MDEAFERFLNVVDVEATCWADGPPWGESSEIIEIGICVVDTRDWRRVERRRIRGDDDAWNIGALVVDLARLGRPVTA
ncbi:hypothetical protein [Actinoplanes sp. NPDC026623]|uniref:hypothetical protein n=1 Tax=Actinoplanes sp. NPDC026623 TaxID=3155610 RepID=UPI0034097F03